MKTKKSNNILKDAIRDAELLKEAALVNAKRFISSDLSQKTKTLLERQISEEGEEVEDRVEDEDELAEGEGQELGFNDGAKVEKRDNQTLEEEEELDLDDEDEEMTEGDDLDLDDEDEEMNEEDEIGDDDEEVDLEEVLSELEGNDDDDEDIDIEEAFIGDSEPEDIVKLDKQKDSFTPPKIKVSEMRQLRKEVKRLRTENLQLRKVVTVQKKAISEVSLFNKKLRYATKLIDLYPLNIREKKAVYEQFDRASTINEAKLVYNSLKSILGGKKRRRLTEINSRTRNKVIKEEIVSNNGYDKIRLQELAGMKVNRK